MEVISLIGGDARFFWAETISYFVGIPHAWDASLNTGTGQPGIGTLWITGYLHATLLFTKLGLSWNTILFLFWLLPSLVIGFLSASYAFDYFSSKKSVFRWQPSIESGLAGLIYIGNSYFMMNFFGGQTGIVLAYSLGPFVLLRFMKLCERATLRNSLFAGLAISLQLLFDPRFVYMSAGMIILYFFWLSSRRLKGGEISRNDIFFTVIVPACLVFLLHSYWIVPLLFFKAPALPGQFDSVKGFEFFSFADFSHAFALLHPNWPENIFGKVYFLEPYFLLIPMLAYTGLLLTKSKIEEQKSKLHIKNKKFGTEITKSLQYDVVLFFCLLGLIGAFFAKGASEPFGVINVWLFGHLPGMQMFRDPTKFYYLIALSYSFLIPWTVSELHARYKKRLRINQAALVGVLIVCWLLLHSISYFRYPLKSPFVKAVPQEYVQLKDFILNDGQSFRTLWIPQWQRYGYFSPVHPAIGRGEILGQADPVTLAKRLEKKHILETLRLYGVRYIILPFDSEGELFISDRKYDEKIYQQVQSVLDKNTAFRLQKVFGKIRVYELDNYSGRFLLDGKDPAWTYIAPAHYQIEPENGTIDGTVVFSEAYSPHWIAEAGGQTVVSQKYKGTINSFRLTRSAGTVDIYYQPQQWIQYGLVLSGVTLLATIVLLLAIKEKKI